MWPSLCLELSFRGFLQEKPHLAIFVSQEKSLGGQIRLRGAVILLGDDFGAACGSRVPLAGRQLPVLSA
jgi:hypothetical protein